MASKGDYAGFTPLIPSDLSSLQRLGRPVVSQQAAGDLILSGAQEAAEFGQLLRTNIYGFSQDNPDDTLKKRWNGQRAKVSPVVQGLGKQAAGIEVCEECSFALDSDGVQAVSDLLQLRVAFTNLQKYSHDC